MIDPDVYRRAARTIRSRGLYRHCYADYSVTDGPVCTVGALNVVLTGDPGTWSESTEYLVPLADLIPHVDDYYDDEGPFGAVTHWSDSEGRTAEEAASLLEQAADKVEGAMAR